MPLPNCGYFNKEEKKTQELVFESPPEIVEGSDSDEGIGGSSRSSSSGKRIRAKVTKGIPKQHIYFMHISSYFTAKKSFIKQSVVIFETLY